MFTTLSKILELKRSTPKLHFSLQDIEVSLFVFGIFSAIYPEGSDKKLAVSCFHFSKATHAGRDAFLAAINTLLTM